MDNLPRGPSASLKFLATAARWAFGLALAAWLVFGAAWIALHGLIVPRIDELRPQLEAQASRALGVPVRIGAIHAHSAGLVPSFELTDVRLYDAAGLPALHLSRVLAALSPRSLWNLGFEQIYIERPQLRIERTADGRLLIAGLDFSRSPDSDGRAADWFFSQTEFVIRDGTLEWVDTLRGTPTLQLHELDFVARNRLRQHALRLDATPPADWGGRLTLQAQMRQPLLSVHAGRWREWDGQLHALFERVDLARLGPYLPAGLRLTQGTGALRAWADLRRGDISGAVADVQLHDLRASAGAQRADLVLPTLSGRLGGRRIEGGFDLHTQNLRFETEDGLRWPGGNVRLSYAEATGAKPAHGSLQGEQLDLAALARVAGRLPLDETWLATLNALAPRGLVERIQSSWRGPLEAPVEYEARGRIGALGWAASAPGRPGVQGLDAEFELTQAGGRASLSMREGQLSWPGLFDEAALPVRQLSTTVQWQSDAQRLALQLPNLKFMLDQTAGEAQLKWQRGAADDTGVFDLQGQLGNLDVTQLHRYWPQALNREVRDYLRAAVPQGQLSGLRWRFKGAPRDWPFRETRQGDFRVSAHVRNATFAYVPPYLQAAGSRPWPALTQLNGELVLERAGLSLRNVNARVANSSTLRISRADASIADLLQTPTVSVQAQAQGPLTELLTHVVNGSPLHDLTHGVLAQASASGSADYQFRLNLPLATLDKSTVQARLVLPGNDLQLMPNLPRLARARGTVHFSERGFVVSAGQARALGGDLRIEGGSIAVPGSAPARPATPPILRVQGQVTAEGLRQASELGQASRLARYASGSAAYALVLDWRSGTPELLLTSTLQGLTLDLPPPLRKPAEASLPLRLESRTLSSTQALWSLDLGRLLTARYVRDEAQAPRGALGIGLDPGQEPPVPDTGVVANVHLAQANLDAWSALLDGATPAIPSTSAGPSPLRDYLPTSVAIRADELTLQGRHLHQVVVGASRDASVWRANLDARELNGYLEYRPSASSSPGRLYARLARLALAQANANEVESLLDQQPSNIPALDIVIGELELRGKHLGRVEIDAVNRGAREWRLNRLTIGLPQAQLTASGSWSPPVELSLRAPRSAAAATPEYRRTLMDFRLEISDAGELLSRLGMPEVIRRGRGKMEGQVSWIGSPLSIDYPSLNGAFNVNVENGQFLKAEPGIAKLLGVLSLQSLPRRLTLDFRDVFSEGFGFDFVRGDIMIQQGIARTNNLQMKGVNAAVLMEGQADIARETQDLKVVVVPEINAGTASLITAWINPVAGLSSFLAQVFLRQPLIASATQEFHIDGSWSDPHVTRGERPSAPPEKAAP